MSYTIYQILYYKIAIALLSKRKLLYFKYYWLQALQYKLFLLTNNNWLTTLDDKRVLLEVIWFPASENKRSLGTEVAGIDKYFLLKIGNERWLPHHYW